MALFTKEQADFISNSITIAMSEMVTKHDDALANIKTVFEDAKADQLEMRNYIQAHQNELIQNSQRVSDLVTDANAKADALGESMAKIVGTEQKFAHLTTQLNDFGAKEAESIGGQSAKVASTSAELEDLRLRVSAALSHLDDRLEAAVAHCNTSALTDVETCARN